jgi:4-coumarate--CoA ligase
MNVAPWSSPYPVAGDLLDADAAWHTVSGDASKKQQDKPAYVDGLSGEQITYGELRSVSRRLAHALRHQLGLQPKAVVCVVAANHLMYPAFVQAALAAGLICTFANSAFTVTEMTHILKDSDVQLLVTDHLALAREAARAKGLPDDRIFTLAKEDSTSIWNLMDHQQVEPAHLTPVEARTTTALRCYSSGTTGLYVTSTVFRVESLPCL